MATTTTPAQPRPDLLQQQRRATAYGLFWGAILLGLLTWWLGVRYWTESTLVVVGIGLLALITFGLAGWQLPVAATTQVEALRRQRKQIAFALFIEVGLLILLMIWLAAQQGFLPAFPELSSAGLLALIAGGAGLYLLGEPGGVSRQETILLVLLRNRQVLLGCLFGLAAALVVLGVVLFVSNGRASFPEGAGAILIALVLAAAALWLVLNAGTALTANNLRVAVLTVGGLTGVLIAAMTALRALMWWNSVFAGGIRVWQGEGAWRLWVCFYVELLGLAIIFGSLLLAQADVRTNPVLRRLLFGYNTVLTGLLLLGILVVVNVAVYASYPYTFEWTKTRGLYALEDRSKRTLEGLKETTTVYVLLSPNSDNYRDVHTLLENAQAFTNKLQVEYISPDLQTERYREMVKRYPKLAQARNTPDPSGGRGLLVAYGPESATGRQAHAFIPASSLSEDKPGRKEGTGIREFRGEDVLMTELRFLARDEQRPVIYFTQGHSELDINNSRLGDTEGAGLLVAKLKQQRYEVKGLMWGAPPRNRGKVPQMEYTKKTLEEAHTLPKDAKVLVIAQPQLKYPRDVLDVLDHFVQNGGKLLVLSNLPVRTDTFAPVETGLEDVLKRYGVELGKDYILRYIENGQDDPLVSKAAPATRSSNPIPVAFRKRDFYVFLARPIRPTPGAGNYVPETILEIRSPPNPPIFWAESNLETLRHPVGYVIRLTVQQVEDKRSQEPIPVGVAVADRKGQPTMVVYGDAFMASNDERFPSAYFDLLVGSMEWLAGRPENIGIEPRTTNSFAFRRGDVNLNRMTWLPLGLSLLGLIGLGTGVWLVRVADRAPDNSI